MLSMCGEEKKKGGVGGGGGGGNERKGLINLLHFNGYFL